MSTEDYTDNTINIEASQAVVWDILTNPQKTIIYMFGCAVDTDWAIGSPILWKGAQDGVTYVSGKVVTYEPEKKLVYTVIDPHGEYEDVPESYLTVTYELSQEGDSTQLRVTQGDYSKVPNGEARYKDAMDQGGWQSILVEIKKAAEMG